jgi:hypothetical protein
MYIYTLSRIHTRSAYFGLDNREYECLESVYLFVTCENYFLLNTLNRGVSMR